MCVLLTLSPGLRTLPRRCGAATGLGAPRKRVSLPAAMMSSLLGSDFSPLLRSLSFLLVRLHNGPAEVSANVANACLLHSPLEDKFARQAHAALQAVRAVSLPERTAVLADELSLPRLEWLAPVLTRMLTGLRAALDGGSFDAVQPETLSSAAGASATPARRAGTGAGTGAGAAASASASARHIDDLTGATIPTARAAYIFHTLSATSLCLELIRIPLTGVLASVSEPLTQWRRHRSDSHQSTDYGQFCLST